MYTIWFQKWFFIP